MIRSAIITASAAAALTLATAAFAAPALARPAPAGPTAGQAAASASCGYWRWPVKTGSDANRYQVDQLAWNTSIRYLRGLNPPPYFGSYAQDHRIKWPEFHTWRLRHTYVVEVIEEDDSDLHLILRNRFGNTMIAEIPSPACVSASSLWKTRIEAARQAITSRYTVSHYYWTHIGRYAKVKGLGFFDEIHGQTGVAPNGIELHPVTRIVWR